MFEMEYLAWKLAFPWHQRLGEPRAHGEVWDQWEDLPQPLHEEGKGAELSLEGETFPSCFPPSKSQFPSFPSFPEFPCVQQGEFSMEEEFSVVEAQLPSHPRLRGF